MRSRVSGRVVQTTTCAKQKQHNNQFRDFMAMFVIPQNITKWLRVALVVHGVRDFRSRVSTVAVAAVVVATGASFHDNGETPTTC